MEGEDCFAVFMLLIGSRRSETLLSKDDSDRVSMCGDLALTCGRMDRRTHTSRPPILGMIFLERKKQTTTKKQTFAGTILKSGPSQTLVITAYNKLFPSKKLKGTLNFWFYNSQKFPVFLLTPRFDH